MEKIALFFGPLDGNVHRVALKVKAAMGEEKIDLIPVKNASEDDLKRYDQIIFGISTVGKETWDATYANNDWDIFLPNISKVDFSQKTVAIFGLGDHITYATAFVDSMGTLAKALLEKNANIIGQVSVDDYEFDDSLAIFDGMFIGLPIDEDFEPELTDQRVSNWVANLKKKWTI